MAMYTSSYINKALATRPEGPRHEGQVEGEKTIQPSVARRTVDLAGPYVKLLQNRFHAPSFADAWIMQPTPAAGLEVLPPIAYAHQPATNFNTRFVHVSLNKMRTSVNSLIWTPEGRRCITGTQSGEFTLWNGTQFNFETIIQAHESPVRSMQYAHNENWLLTGEDDGKLKYWKPNLECVKAEPAHKEAVRGIAFSPSDLKFASCSDDSTIKVWDFPTCKSEVTMTGHGGDVKSCDWHPTKAVLASGSKDGLVKVWDAKTGRNIATLHGHRNTVMQTLWNANGNWLLSACRDQSLKVTDMRTQKEIATYRGHNRDVTCAAWHPLHEELFASGGYDGSLMYWLVSSPEPQAEKRGAHDSVIWTLAWHPAGHMLATGSGDTCTKFWGRARPGDPWRDREQREQEETAATEGEVATGKNRQLASVDAAVARDSMGAIPGIGEAVTNHPPGTLSASRPPDLPPGIDTGDLLPPPPPGGPTGRPPGPPRPPAQAPSQHQQRLRPQMSGWGPSAGPPGSAGSSRKREYGSAFPDQGIQEHGRGRLARPLGEPAGHGAQQLPRQPTYPNAHPGQYKQTPTRSQGTGPSPQHRMGSSPQHQMQGSPQRQPQGRHQPRDRAGAIMRPQLTGALLRPQYAAGPPPVQHQSPLNDHMLSPPHGPVGQSQISSPPQDPRSRGGQGQTKNQGYNSGYRQDQGQTSGDQGPLARQGPPAAAQYPSRGQDYANSPEHDDDQIHQQGHQHSDSQGRGPGTGQTPVRFGRGGGHVSGAKAILLPGPPFGGQGNRGRGRGRSDGTYINPRGRGRGTKGRG